MLDAGGTRNPWRRIPTLFRGLRPVRRAGVIRDALSGATLAAMNVPQALGYTRIAGMPVVTGLYTLLLPLVAFATFGSSRYLVVAADSATAAILAGGLSGMAPVASPRYVELAGTVALLTAGLLLLARLFRLGFLADFLSRTVLVGFLTGVGVQVGIAVFGEMAGLEIRANRTLAQVAEIADGLPRIHVATLALSAALVALVVGLRAISPRLPGPLVAVVGSIAASAWFDFSGHGIAVIGPVEGGLPGLALPAVGWAEAWNLLPVAASCFLMIVTQSAATARVYAARHRDVLDEDADLVGLSAANLTAGLSGTFVVNGSPTQTAMVDRSGGRSQIAHLATAVIVALVLVFLTGPLRDLPRCALGAIVFTIAIGLVDVRGLRDIRSESVGEFRLALVTAAVVVLVGVEQGILFAMALSLLRHVRHSYRPHTAILVRDEAGAWVATPPRPGVRSGPGLVVYRFAADLFYANVGRFVGEIRDVVGQPGSADASGRGAAPLRWLVVDAGAITSVDYSAAVAVRDLLHELADGDVTLVLAHVQSYLRADLDRHRLTTLIGGDRIFGAMHEALAALERQGA